MKRILCYAVLACLLAGCGQEPVMETVADELVFSQAEPKQIQVHLPEETVLPVMETEDGSLYLCRDFEVSVQTLPGGDLERTVRSLTGFSAADVTIMETASDGLTRYDLAWSCAGELGPQVGRASILSDAGWHYCLTAMTAEENAQSYWEIFNGMFESFAVG